MRQYHHRPATDADVPAIHALVTACETALHGHPETDADAIAADFARTGLRMETDTRLIHHDDGTLAARAWVNRRSEIDVHPDHHRQGLGTALLDWAETRARETGAEQITQTIADNNTAAVELVRAHGYQGKVTSWLLEITYSDHAPPLSGLTTRPYQPGDAHAVHRLLEDAFDEWQQRRKTYEEWVRHTVERTTFAPAMSPIALHGNRIVGAAIALDDPASPEGYIDRLAVHPDHRHQGIARHLLQRSFETFRRHGKPSTTLWTHSDTGALTLYQSIGMTVRRSSTVYRKDLSLAHL
ncbi:MAG TPA: GNAT family N-acetyltransferase [Candidatus Limnocylindrales bacterium]|nr:GNAT family N-acetyltransferase [Candidatus Limnocylindrales bacterium]